MQTKNQQLKDYLKKIKLEKEEFISKTNEVITNANNNIIAAKDEILEIQNQHTKEIKEKDSEIREVNRLLQDENTKLIKEKDTSKTLLLALYSYEERGIITDYLTERHS